MNQWKKRILVIICGILLVTSMGAFQTAGIHPVTSIHIPRNVRFETIVSGLNQPLYVTHAGDGTNRLFIVERGGKIRILQNGSLHSTSFLNIGKLINKTGGEQGLLGLAFHPDFAVNRYFYVTYISLASEITLARYTVSVSNPNYADPNSGTILLIIPKTRPNHNGGMLAFGPDGYLYMSTGDSGGAGDPDNLAQDQTSLLGKLLRLDVDSVSPYAIPPDNPFVGSPNPFVKKEIWAYGLRNPWRFSFDKQTGDLYIADVGQNTEEELNFQAASSGGGENYGWDVLEGDLCYDPPLGCTPPLNYVQPVHVYDHGINDEYGCAITGGYVYRGGSFPAMQGVYLFGDYCTGMVTGFIMYTATNGQMVRITVGLADTNYQISSFGEDEQGGVYLTDYAGGSLIHIAEAPIITKKFLSQGAYDGWVLETSETSNMGGTVNNTGAAFYLGDDAENRQYRAILSFNTASIPDNAIILSATLKFKIHSIIGINPFDFSKYLIVHIKTGKFSNSVMLQSSDFQAPATIFYSIAHFGNPCPDKWLTKNVMPLLDLTGTTQYRLRFLTDDNNNGQADYIRFYSGDISRWAYRPSLTVTYYVQY